METPHVNEIHVCIYIYIYVFIIYHIHIRIYIYIYNHIHMMYGKVLITSTGLVLKIHLKITKDRLRQRWSHRGRDRIHDLRVELVPWFLMGKMGKNLGKIWRKSGKMVEKCGEKVEKNGKMVEKYGKMTFETMDTMVL